MKNSTKVMINLNVEDANKLGITKAIENQEGVVEDTYPKGLYVRTKGKLVAIATKYNALTEIEEVAE